MTKFGEVTAYNERTGMATIRYTRPEACEKCGGCGSASHYGEITLAADCHPGNWVRVELPEGRFLTATALAYALPLCGLLAGLFLGNAMGGGGDLPTLLGGVLGLLVALGFVVLADRRIRARADWTPQVAEVYPEKPTQKLIGCEGDGL